MSSPPAPSPSPAGVPSTTPPLETPLAAGIQFPWLLRRDKAGRRELRVDLALIVTIVLAMVIYGWTGFLGSDDPAYAQAAIGWIERFPFCGQNHWALRHPVVLPIAVSFLCFGVGEFSLILPTIAYFVALVCVTYLVVGEVAGRATGRLAAIVLATTPLLATGASVAAPDIVELFFCVVSLGCFGAALRTSARLRWLFAAGISAGLAFETRETAVALIAFYGVLFLVGFGIRRLEFAALAIGFAAVVALEMVYLFATSGDALHRFHLDLVHDTVIRGSGPSLGTSGNLRLHPVLDPLLVVFLNQEFALLYWFAIPAGIWACRARVLDARIRSAARIVALFGIVWIGCIGALSNVLYLLPRYFYPATWSAAVLVGGWLALGVWPRSRRAAILASALLLVASQAGIYVDNRDALFPERALIEFVRQTDETVFTDPCTALRADFLLRVEGLHERVRAQRPVAGGLYLHVPSNAAKGRAAKRSFSPLDFEPEPAWPVVWQKDPGRKWSGIVLEALGFASWFPPAIWRKLDRPNAVVRAYRAGIAQVPSANGGGPP